MTSDVKTLRRRSPLDGLAGELAAAGFAERPFRVQVELRVAPGVAVDPLEEVLGLRLPDRVGTVTRDGERHALCLAPHWWLVTDAPEEDARLECALVASVRAVGGADVSAVDVSAQRTTVDVSGPHARDVLAHGCALDLHPSVFGVDSCTQTTVAKAQVVLQRLAEDTYRLHVRASFAEYLGRWLVDAATEYVRRSR